MDGRGKDCTRRRFLGCGVAGAVAGMVGCEGDEIALGHPGVDHGTSGPTRHTTSAGTDVWPPDVPDPLRPAVSGEGSGGGESGVDEPLPPPNIVFITLDDLGWSTLAPYGNPYIETPAIASLAAGGVLFDHAFLVTSSCSSSRGVYLTGQYPHTNGLVGLVHRHPEMAIPTEHPTLPRLLGDVGYTCAIQGKWHVSAQPPTEYGFHEFLNDVTGTNKIHHAEHAIDFVRRHATTPFFLELDFVEPHLPWNAHDGVRVDPSRVHVLEHWMLPDWPEIRELAARYFVEVVHCDRVIGQLLDELDALGLSDNTFIAVTSDNGSPFPGNKMTLYDRGIRAPLVVRWPMVVPAGTRSESLVSIVDLPQAIAMAATGGPAAFMQGSPAFLDLLRDPTRTYGGSVYAEMTYHGHYCPARAVRTDRWKYIRNLSPDAWGLGEHADAEWAQALLELEGHDWLDERPPVELYDLASDPHEVHNLADAPEYADVRAEMHASLVAHAEATGDDAYDLDP